MEGQAYPAGFTLCVAGEEALADGVGVRFVDGEEVVAIWARAVAAAAGLDAELVVEFPDDGIVVGVGDEEGDDAEAAAVVRGEDADTRNSVEAGEERSEHFGLALPDGGDAHFFLEADTKGRLYPLEDGWGAAVLAVFDVRQVAVLLPGIAVEDGAASGLVGDVIGVEFFIKDQYPGSAGTAEEFMAGEIDGVEGGRGGWRMHVDGHIGRRAGEVDEAVSALFVQQGGDPVPGRFDPRDVGAGGDGGDLCPAVAVM